MVDKYGFFTKKTGLGMDKSIDILGPRLPKHTSCGRDMHEDSRWRRQPGKKN